MFPFDKYKSNILNLCSKYKVKRLYFFGSSLTNRFDQTTSDVDVLVEMLPMKPIQRGQRLTQFWLELEKLFARKVDLLTPNSLHNPFLIQEINNTKQLFYDHQSQKVPV